LTGTTAGIILSLIGLSVQISDALIGMLIGGGTYLLIAITAQLILKKEGLGGGDIKLMAMIGLILGWKLTLVSMLLSVYIGGLIGSILLFFKIKNRTDTIPYGPIIAFGTFITMLFGNELLSWYITLL